MEISEIAARFAEGLIAVDSQTQHVSANPRTGEILESHIGWYHNIMSLLRNWYLIQTAAVDPAARKKQFDDNLILDVEIVLHCPVLVMK
jgi:hypothetical protein